MTPADPVPAWLLKQVGLDDGKFDEGGRTVTGQPNKRLRAVLNVGQSAPRSLTVSLTETQLVTCL
jgi:hypothetical protein